MQIKSLYAPLLPPGAGMRAEPTPKGRPEAVTPSMKPQCNAPEGNLPEACAEMESIFIYHLLKEMQATIPQSGLLDGGVAKEIYEDMLHQQLAGDLASGGGIGLAEILMAQLADGSGEGPG